MQRAHVGKFYFRPPGGESWCDVILRLRSLTDTMGREHGGQRVLIVAHQVTVNCMRYLLERLDEAQILEIDRLGDVPNCGITSCANNRMLFLRSSLLTVPCTWKTVRILTRSNRKMVLTRSMTVLGDPTIMR